MNRFLLCFLLTCVYGSPEKDRLMTNLLSHYVPSIPTLKENTTITLGLGLGIARAEIDEDRGVLTANLWLRMIWKDYRLEWNPSEYGGVTMLHIPSEHLWKPDITLYHYSIDAPKFGRDHNAVVSANGSVLDVVTMLVKTDCTYEHVDNRDVYSCPLVLGSYTYDARLLEFDYFFGQKVLDADDFKVTKQGWTVVGKEAKIDVKYYPCCPDDPQPIITFDAKFAKD